MKTLAIPSIPLGAALAFAFAPALFLNDVRGDVVINEIGAASSGRLLRPHPDGRPRVGWGPSWSEFEFDDSDWEVGTSPFGYGADDVATDVGEAMDGRTPSLYLRQTFTVSAEDAAKEEPFRLSAMADSGFVAFINGHEVARGNLGRRNGFVYHDQSTFSSYDDDKKIRYESVVLASECLREGENIFAVQVQNSVPKQINERDRAVDSSLRFEGDLVLGLGIFAGGSNIKMEMADEGWRYRVGYTEPSGGMVDWAHAANPEVEAGFSDWLELHNNGDSEVDLTGWSLTDNPEMPKLWSFPEGTTIPAGGYLVVLADGMSEVEGDYLHTNFGLAANGEFIGLANASGEFVSQFEDGYPNQNPFHSFGRSAVSEDTHVYFSQPSPGKANGGEELVDRVRRVRFEPGGGVYDETVELTLTSNTEDVIIRYTLDGSEPTEFHGMVYEGPITIEAIDEKTGTPVRARAFKDGHVASGDESQTYLVGVDEAFKTIPSMSLISDPGYAFYKPHGVMSVEGGGGLGENWVSRDTLDYYMPDMHGRSFERRVSMEMIYPEDNTNVQIHSGLRLAASAWSRGRFRLASTNRSPWPSQAAEKPSFNMFFRGDYGDDTLNFPLVENYPVRAFRQLRLRAGKNDINNPWITDELSRRLVTDTGQLGSVGINNALWVNGVYKGYYNSVARLREELFQDLYGNSHPWQVKHIDVWADGTPFPEDPLRDTPEWDHLESLLAKDLSVLENYLAVLEELDPVNFADYFIVNMYGATWDWPHNNLVIARALDPTGRWRAYMWDAEGMFGTAGGHGVTYNSIKSDFRSPRATPSDDLATVWQALVESPEWRLTFADRLQKHFFTPGGALTKENITRRLDELVEEIQPLMRFSGGGVLRTSGFESWIERREDVLFKTGKQFEDEDLWGDVQVPALSPNGGGVEAGTKISVKVGSIFSPQTGDIFYTTDGSDPREMGGEPSATAILYDRDANPGISIDSSVVVKARVRQITLFDPVGKWSALQEASYRVGLEPATAENLLVTELMVDPERPNDEEEQAEFSTSNFEYIEFYNPTDVAVDLGELRFTAGIDYIFSEGEVTTLGPGAYGVIVNDREAFTMRNGEGLPILGQYNKKLRNEGEHLEISDGSYKSIVSIVYSNADPWPNGDEMEGHSLVRTNLAVEVDANDPANWGASSLKGGSPGRAEGAAPPDPPAPSEGYDDWKLAQFGADAEDEAIAGPDADPDADGDNNLVEFAFGNDALDAGSSLAMETSVQTEGDTDYLTLSFVRRTDGVDYTLESSADLSTWAPANDVEDLSTEPAGEGLEQVTVKVPLSETAEYVRWNIEL